MLLSKKEALMLINDLAEQLCKRIELDKLPAEEAAMFQTGVQMLRSDFIKRVDDYV